MEDQAKIIERISKLLAMAKGASSPEEAAIAAERARKLMDMHQLEEADIPERDGKPQVSYGKHTSEIQRTKLHLWQRQLSYAVGEYNDCMTRVTTDGRIAFYGYDADAFLAQQMFEYLAATVRALANHHKKNYPESEQRKHRNAYRNGATAELCTRLKAMTTKREEDVKTSAGTSLVVIKRDHVSEHFNMDFSGKKSAVRQINKMDSFMHGRNDAKNIAIHKEVGSGAGKKLLK
jgi:hypothetical protein